MSWSPSYDLAKSENITEVLRSLMRAMKDCLVCRFLRRQTLMFFEDRAILSDWLIVFPTSLAIFFMGLIATLAVVVLTQKLTPAVFALGLVFGLLILRPIFGIAFIPFVEKCGTAIPRDALFDGYFRMNTAVNLLMVSTAAIFAILARPDRTIYIKLLTSLVVLALCVRYLKGRTKRSGPDSSSHASIIIFLLSLI